MFARILSEQDEENYIAVDQYFENEALKIGAEKYIIPTMIREDILKKCGYFNSFPHHLTIAAYIDKSKYNDVSKSGEINENQVKISNLFFTPSACLHIYPTLENKTLSEKVITTHARVYRYENEQYDGIRRLWDFSVREIVFIGTQNYVNSQLKYMEKITKDFCEKINLPIDIKYSNDYFYPNRINSLKERIQKTNSLKKEVVVKIGDKETAIASFNFHGNHFSKPFNFDNNNTIVSGCIGFGLERWVAALAEYKINL